MKYITLIATVFLPVLTIANPFKIVIESSDLGTEGGTCTDKQSYCATDLVDQQGKPYKFICFDEECAMPRRLDS